MRKRVGALFAVAALVLMGLGALAAAVGWTSWGLALFAAGALCLSVRVLLDLRSIRSNLLTMRRAQAALYERTGQITRDVRSPGGGPSGGRERLSPAVDVLDPGLVPLSLLQDAELPTRLLILGPAGFLHHGRVQELRNLALGQGELAKVPHMHYTHIVIDPGSLVMASQDDRVWLQRALRWQVHTVIALPTAHTDLDLVATVFGVTPGVDERGPWTVLHAPLGCPPGWGEVTE